MECERARLTRILAGMQEASGDVDAARKTMQDTVVETLGGMDKREKTDFILEQVRLCLETGDFVRANIVARKIQTKIFKDPELDDLKIRYYSMNVRFHLHSHNWLDVFRGHQAMWDSPSVQAAEASAHRCLKLQVDMHPCKSYVANAPLSKVVRGVGAPLPRAAAIHMHVWIGFESRWRQRAKSPKGCAVTRRVDTGERGSASIPEAGEVPKHRHAAMLDRPYLSSPLTISCSVFCCCRCSTWCSRNTTTSSPT